MLAQLNRCVERCSTRRATLGGSQKVRVPPLHWPPVRSFTHYHRWLCENADLAANFVTVAADFHALEPFWWLPPAKQPSGDNARATYEAPRSRADVTPLRESDADVDRRIRALVLKLHALPQTHIAVVGHSSFFKRMLGMGRKLRNCELIEVPFADVAERFGLEA